MHLITDLPTSLSLATGHTYDSIATFVCMLTKTDYLSAPTGPLSESSVPTWSLNTRIGSLGCQLLNVQLSITRELALSK